MQRLHLRGAHVIDGTGAPARRADVLTADDKILAVGPDLTLGGDVVECGGLVLCPGFIDTHAHSDLAVLADPDLPMKVRQGITLDVLGQDGLSVAPVTDEAVEQSRRQLAGLLGDPDLPRTWRSVSDYFTLLDRGAALHTAYLVPHGAARAVAMGWDDRDPTAQELATMVATVGQAMDEGAIGLSTGLVYPPCCFAAIDELIALCAEVARRHGVFAVHLRSESDHLLEAVDEMLEVARRSGVHLHLSHLKVAGRRNFAEVDALITKIEAARLDGVRVTADQYPYTAGATMLSAILPPWAHAGGPDATLARLGNRHEHARIVAALQQEGPSDWDHYWSMTGPEGIVISDISSGRHPELIGLSLAHAAERAHAKPIDFALDLLESERLGVAMITHSQSEEVVVRLLKLPWVNACTDGLLGGRPHPRAYGTFPRLLGRYCREQRVLPLEEMIRKLTSQAAAAMHLPRRGRIAAGHVADLVAFDPARVADHATFEDPLRFPTGIEHVIVAGTPVVQAGQPTGARPGRAVRRKSAPA
jgi:N-acyl-D-amino-acid deacylase